MQEPQETWVQVSSLGWEDLLEEGMATHSSILAWRIAWTEESGGLQPTGLQRVRHHWGNLAQTWTPGKPSHVVFQTLSSFTCEMQLPHSVVLGVQWGGPDWPLLLAVRGQNLGNQGGRVLPEKLLIRVAWGYLLHISLPYLPTFFKRMNEPECIVLCSIFFFHIYLLIWLCQGVLVVARGIFSMRKGNS